MTPDEWRELQYLAGRVLAKHQEILSSCTGKARFETRSDAMTTIRRRSMREICAPYHCPVCSGWHVGDQRATRKKRKAIKANYLRMAR